jgi:hypothetical protein
MPAQKVRSTVFNPHVAGIHVLLLKTEFKASMGGPSPAMTQGETKR